MLDRYRLDLDSPTPTLNASVAKILHSQTPKHAWLAHPRLNPEYRESHDTKFDLGSAAHAMLLQPERDLVAIGAFDDYKTKAAQLWKAEVYEAGRIPIL